MKARAAQVIKHKPAADFLCAVCGEPACFGLTFPLALPEQWFCPTHKPEDYYRRSA